MKKATKVIVSGLAGLALFAGGMGAGAMVYNEKWEHEETISKVEQGMTDLDTIIGNRDDEIEELNDQKEVLNGQKEVLESELNIIESGAQKLISDIIPGLNGLPTKQQLVKAAEWIKENPTSLPGNFERVLVSLETDLGITKKPTDTIGTRLNSVIVKYDTITKELGRNNIKLHEANSIIKDLKETGSANTTEISRLKQKITELEQELEKANDDGFGLLHHSNEIMEKYQDEIAEMKE